MIWTNKHRTWIQTKFTCGVNWVKFFKLWVSVSSFENSITLTLLHRVARWWYRSHTKLLAHDGQGTFLLFLCQLSASAQWEPRWEGHYLCSLDSDHRCFSAQLLVPLSHICTLTKPWGPRCPPVLPVWNISALFHSLDTISTSIRWKFWNLLIFQ